MSKKHTKQKQTEPARQAEIAPASVRTFPEAAAAPAEKVAPPVSKAMIFVFWGVVVLALFLAWILDYLLPDVPESLIERWIMGGFAVFLGIFLYKLK